MASCCEDKSCAITAMQERHGWVLWVVLLINAVMFLVESGAGLMGHSTSLLADALDMLVGVVITSLFLSSALAGTAAIDAGPTNASGCRPALRGADDDRSASSQALTGYGERAYHALAA